MRLVRLWARQEIPVHIPPWSAPSRGEVGLGCSRDVRLRGPIVAVVGVWAVGHLKKEWGNLLDELILLMNHLYPQAVALVPRHPGEKKPKFYYVFGKLIS